MINIIILVIGLIIYIKISKGYITKTQMALVVGIYVVVQIMLGSGFLSNNPILMILFILGYVLVNQIILFKYKSKINMIVYTIIFMIIIMGVPSIAKDVRGYEVGLTNENIGYLISMVLVLIVGYINIKEGEYNKYSKGKYIVLISLIVVYLLNIVVYYNYYEASISNLEIIEISTCKELKEIENNNKYEIVKDIDCGGEEVVMKSGVMPYKVEINGNGNIISNMQLRQEGLVKINGQSVISNLDIRDVQIQGNGIVGVNYGNIEKVSMVNSNISGEKNIGVVGINRGDINNSYSAGNITSGNENVGGIAGENYGGISNVYSTSRVEGYEYIGGLIGHQGKPGYIRNSFYNDKTDNSELISKGALEILGQDRETMEVMDEMERSNKSVEVYYEEASTKQKDIIDEAYKTDTQDWYVEGSNNLETIENVVVLNNEEYEEYINVGGTIPKGTKSTQSGVAEILGAGAEMTIKAIVGSIVDELGEHKITFNEINVLPYENYGTSEGVGAGGFYNNLYLQSGYGFMGEIWDYSSLTKDSIGSSEPIKLK